MGGAEAPRGAGPTLPSLDPEGLACRAPSPGLTLITPLLLFSRRPVCPPAPSHSSTRWRKHSEPAKPHACPDPTAPSTLTQPHSHQHLAIGEIPHNPESSWGFPGLGGLSWASKVGLEGASCCNTELCPCKAVSTHQGPFDPYPRMGPFPPVPSDTCTFLPKHCPQVTHLHTAFACPAA